MADTTALKNRIRAAIKANDNQEITGPVLQQALLDMVDELNGATETEASARQNGDNTLSGAIQSEKEARQGTDTTLQTNIDNEATARQNADSTLQTNIDNEATARQNADTQLNNLITGIKNNIDNGYVYAGIATPSTTPVSGKVFYLAKQAGHYVNFGGLTVTEGLNILKRNGSAWSQEQLMSMADIYKNPLIGYYGCDTTGNTAAKTVTADGYVLPATGGSMKIKMANRNTAANATLNINSTGAKPLYYNGQRAGIGNTWDTNEIIEVFYDGTNYQAYNVAGSNGDGVFDISSYNLTNGQPTPYANLTAALGTDGANIPLSLRKGGMSVKFIQGNALNADNKYVQFRYMSSSTAVADFTNVDNWEKAEIEYKNIDNEIDLGFSDSNGYTIVEFNEGHIKTKNFDSRDLVINLRKDNSQADLNIGDQNGNVILQLKEGHIKTKNFDSRNAAGDNSATPLDYTPRNLIVSTDEWSGIVPTYAQLIAKWDAMLGEYDDLVVPDDYGQPSSSGYFPYKYRVTKETIGRDQSNTYDIYKYTFSPTDFKRTVFLNYLMHGIEEQTSLAAYQLFEHIVANDAVCQASPVLTYMRKYVRVILIPCLNPWGLMNRRYGNVNLVNVGRNFPYYWNQYHSTGSEWDKKGTKPFSEAETKIFLKVLLQYAGELDFAIDNHTGDGWNNEPFFYYDNTDFYLRPACIEGGDYIAQTTGINNPEVLETTRLLDIFWMNRCLGVPSLTIEFGPLAYSNTRNGTVQLSALMWNYTVYWTRCFSLGKRTPYLIPNSVRRLTRAEYNALPFRPCSTKYYITDENDKVMIGEIEANTGWIEE